MTSKHTITIQSSVPEERVVISIDAITALKESFSGKTTDNPVANRTSVADHYIVNNPVFTFTGVITGVFNPANASITDSAVTVGNLKSVIEGAKLVSFLSGDGDRIIKDCFVEQMMLTRTVKEGVLGWKINCVLKKVNIATGGVETVINVIPDQSASEENKSSSSTKAREEIFQVEGGGVGLSDSEFGKKTWFYGK